MTLEEKVGQMTQMSLHVLCDPDQTTDDGPQLDQMLLRQVLVEVGVGSLFNVAKGPLLPGAWRDLIAGIQDIATSETRLGIPIVFGLDAVHGSGYTAGGTLFPHNLTLAASWQPELAREAGRITAAELAACGVSWNFAPVLDVGRQPIWSRFFETFGEDVVLASTFGEAAVRGHHDVPGIAACGKHFVGYSAPASGRDRTTAWIPDTLLRDVYLPPFQAAIRAGLATVMVNSGDVNREPVHASRFLLTEVLRDELGFRGVVVSDWEDVVKLHTVHRAAPSLRDAVRVAVEAGVDMSMTPYDTDFAPLLVDLVKAGDVGEDLVDRSVRRILTLKEDLGLFANPLPPQPLESASQESIMVSGDAAAAGLVLLENDGVLPLAEDARVRVTGQGGDSRAALCGSWSYTWQGADEGTFPDDIITLKGALADLISEERPDVEVVVLTETPSVEKPGDIDDLHLSAAEAEVLDVAVATGRPVVAVLLFDRPRLLPASIDACSAVVWAGRPGPHGAGAVRRLLSGETEAQGRLPFTYPRHHAELVAYDHPSTDLVSPDYGLTREYGMTGLNPRWSFGHGLSYTQFAVSGLQVAWHPGGGAALTCLVKNAGERAGRYVVQAYVTDEYARYAPAVRKLAGFLSLELRPGEEKTIDMTLPQRAFGYHTRDGFVVEPGDFRIQVGDCISTLTLA